MIHFPTDSFYTLRAVPFEILRGKMEYFAEPLSLFHREKAHDWSRFWFGIIFALHWNQYSPNLFPSYATSREYKKRWPGLICVSVLFPPVSAVEGMESILCVRVSGVFIQCCHSLIIQHADPMSGECINVQAISFIHKKGFGLVECSLVCIQYCLQPYMGSSLHAAAP